MRRLTNCPSCGGLTHVDRFRCPHCDRRLRVRSGSPGAYAAALGLGAALACGQGCGPGTTTPVDAAYGIACGTWEGPCCEGTPNHCFSGIDCIDNRCVGLDASYGIPPDSGQPDGNVVGVDAAYGIACGGAYGPCCLA